MEEERGKYARRQGAGCRLSIERAAAASEKASQAVSGSHAVSNAVSRSPERVAKSNRSD